MKKISYKGCKLNLRGRHIKGVYHCELSIHGVRGPRLRPARTGNRNSQFEKGDTTKAE